jgi:hypothetical protein
MPRQHLVEHRPEGPHVRAPIDDAPFRLLRRHVRRGAENHADARQLGRRHHRRRLREARRAEALRHIRIVASGFSRPHRFRKPKVEDLHHAVTAHLDVGWFEIAVNDPLLVRPFERLGDLLRDRQRLVDRKPLERFSVACSAALSGPRSRS